MGWQGLLAVSFPVAGGGAGAEREVGGLVSKGSKVRHRFDRKISLDGLSDGVERRVTFLEPVDLDPGPHDLTVVLAEGPTTRETRVSIDVPEVPRGELVIIGPILGRRVSSSVVIRSDGGDENGDRLAAAGSFEPLVGERLDERGDILAMTLLCAVGEPGSLDDVRVERTLRGAAGALLGTLPTVPVDLEAEGSVRCQNLLDVVPAGALPDGSYAFEVTLRRGDGAARVSSAPFTVGAPRDD
jgi:hypothetical protein